MHKIILRDGTEIEIKEESTATDIVIEETQETFFDDMADFTDDNLKEFSFWQTNGGTYATFENYCFTGVSLGTDMVAHFHTRAKTELEILQERIAELEAGQTVQDGAIGDLAEIIGG